MKHGSKLFVALLSAAALTVAGCSNDPTPTATPSSSTTADTSSLQALYASIPEGTTVKVGCKPGRDQEADFRSFEADEASFSLEFPNVEIQAVSANPCMDPATFLTRLSGGQLEDVFYTYFTDSAGIMEEGRASDISSVVANVDPYKELRDELKALYQLDGKTYGIPRGSYRTGLVYNRDVFTAAGLDPNSPPTTWDQVKQYAKTIKDVAGVTGFGAYNDPGGISGWEFTKHIYSRGGKVTDAGTSAIATGTAAKDALAFMKDLRWTDQSTPSEAGVSWGQLLEGIGTGQMGMMIGAPDIMTFVNNDFDLPFEKIGLGPMPGGGGTLLGGDGFMFKAGLDEAKIKAGVLFLSWMYLLPGNGNHDWERAKNNGQVAGLPGTNVWNDGSKYDTENSALVEAYGNLPAENYEAYLTALQSIPIVPEPAPKGQEVYGILGPLWSEVQLDANFDIDAKLAAADAAIKTLLG